MGNAEWTLQLRRSWRIVALAAVLASLLGTVVIAALGVALWPVRPGSHSVFQFLLSKHCAMLLRVLGVRVVRDPYRSPDSGAPTLYLANHVSYLDILVLAAQWRTGFLAKSEVGTWPPWWVTSRAPAARSS